MMDSPASSALYSTSLNSSSTSLSSLESSIINHEKPAEKETAALIDTYGNDFEIPDFTIKQIRDAIPSHCFEKSTVKGLGYAVRDLSAIGLAFFLANQYVTPETIPWQPVRALCWGLYGFVVGLFGMGLWTLGHECGHGAFSNSRTVNDFVGWCLHSILLVPYFSFKLSHSKHHKGTGHMERDTVFLPETRREYFSRFGLLAHQLSELTEESPIMTLWMFLVHQLIAWPYYLVSNLTSYKNHEDQREGRGKGKFNGLGGGVNHFDPRSPLFDNKDVPRIIYSDIGVGLVIAAIVAGTQTYGWTQMALWYWQPYLWANHWLVALTYLHHTDPSVPHYQRETWTFARGATATIDRDFGWIGRHIFHGIIEHHVVHHLVSSIPFYHGEEATEAIKPVMGRHYRSDTVGGPWGFLRAMWRTGRHCQWVEPCAGTEGERAGVLFYRNRNGVGAPPMHMKAK